MQEVASPSLSIVVTSRNDDHGGGMLFRMQTFLDCLLDQCSRYKSNVEVILVEWNPPVDRPRLSDALRWPEELAGVVRILEVSPAVHRRFQNSDKLPLFQMIAKNAGIRRAKSSYILATNVDILFSEELIEFLTSGCLEENFIYRTDRYDVASDLPAAMSTTEKLDYCKNHLIRINRLEGTLNVLNGEFTRIYSRLHGMPDTLNTLLARFLPPKIKNQHWYYEHTRLYTKRRKIHTNACGDFTLMAKEHWFALRGYPEFQTYSFHIDSLLCYAACYAGIKEKILGDPMRIYHMEHGGGWSPEVQKAGTLDHRLDSAGIARISNVKFNELTVQMHDRGEPTIFNDEHWGLLKENLQETVIGSRGKNGRVAI